jgi:serine/threonine-protein kinase
MTTRSPHLPQPYEDYVIALVDSDTSMEVIVEVLRQRWTLLPPAEREIVTIREKAKLDVLTGDFEAAGRGSVALAALTQGSTALEAHLAAAELELELAVESGRGKAAADVAESFLRRHGAWTPGGTGQNAYRNWTQWYEPVFIDALRRGGRIDEAQATSRLEAWSTGTTGRESIRNDGGRRWAFVTALAATDEPRAQKALEAFEASWSRNVQGGIVGRITGSVLVRAGRAAEALPWLHATAGSCTTFENPFEAIRARRWLGEALERTGDKRGACAAYSAVLARWGKAKPRSVTADEARGRALALGCDAVAR